MMGKKRIAGAAAVAAVLAVTMLGAGLAGAGVEIRPPDVKFKLSAYGTLIDFETDAIAHRITVGSNIVFFESLKMGTYASPLVVAVQNADMTMKTFEEKIVEFDLAAPTGTGSYARLSDGGRMGFFSVFVNEARLRKFTSLGGFQATNRGWYHDKPAGTIHIKTVHSSVNSVSIQWGVPSPAIWVWLGVGTYEDEEAEPGAEIQPGTYVGGEWVPRERFSPGETLFLRALVRDAETSDPVTFAQVPMTLAYDGSELEVRQPESGLYEGSLLLVDIPAEEHTIEVEIYALGYTNWHGEAGFSLIEAPVPPVPPVVVPWWQQWWVWLGFGAVVASVSVVLLWRSEKVT